MANRVAAVLLFVGLALACAAWYASNLGPQSRETIPAEVTLTATEVGSGNWVRYLITVRNLGDVPFEGDVVLSDRDTSAAVNGTAAAVPAPRLPRSVPRLPAQAPDAAYEAHVQVGPRATRTLTLTAPDFYSAVTLAQSSDGSPVQTAAVERSQSAAVAVLTDSQPAAAQLQGLPLDEITVRVTQFTARTFPASALGLAPYSAVIVDQFDLQSLSAPQRDALRDFVGLGGGLVVAGGPSWRRTLPALPAEISPLLATGSAPEPLAALEAVSATSPGRAPALVAAATGELRQGAWPVIQAADGAVLVADAVYGAGTVAALAFDPAAEVAGTELAKAAWTQALGQVLAHHGGAAPGAWTVPAISAQEALSFPQAHTAPLPSPWLVGPVLLLYLVLVAPLNYLVLRRRLRNPDLLWVTAPLIALLFTGGFYWAGSELQGSLRDEQLQVLRLAPDGTVASVDYHRIVFLRRGNHDLATGQPALAAPLTFDLSGSGAASEGGCGERCSLALSGLASGEEHVIPAARPLILERGVVYGGVRVLGTASVSRQPVHVAAHLQAVGGRITGEIDNNGARAVHGLVLYTTEGGVYHRTPLAGMVAPGARVQVSAQGSVFSGDPDAPLASGRPPDAATRISRALGSELLGGGPQSAWLVGFTDPLSSDLRVDGQAPAQSGTAVFEMPVTAERADGEISVWAVRRLVGSAGERARGGFTDVYDLQLPGRLPAQLDVAYSSAGFGAVEVFDWSAGTWRSGGFGDDPTDATRARRALAPGEVAAAAGGALNLVRLRVHEPRLSWGAGLFVLSG